MELIFNIITLIKEFNNHINDYKCDDEMINSVLRKITSVYPQFQNLTLNLDDPVINHNCQSLFYILTKIKKDIKEYQSFWKIKKFTKINDLKKNIEKFDRELLDIFRNLKLNIIMDNSKTINDLKLHLQDDKEINKEILDIKRNSIKLKKESLYEIDSINDKIKNIQNKIDNYILVNPSDICNLFKDIDIFENDYENSLYNLSKNIYKLENTINIMKEKLNFFNNFQEIYVHLENQDKKIKYQYSFKNYFLNFIIEQLFYYFFFILFYFALFITTDTKVYT